jgi:hypothetical protein
MTHSAKRGRSGKKNLIFPDDSDPSRHFSWRAEGGGLVENMLDVRLLLAFCQLLALAECQLLEGDRELVDRIQGS